MRDRLIEFLTKTFDEQYEKRMLITPQHTADHLLANGVVVIRCNIGDTVYQTDGVRIYELEIFDVKLIKNKPYYETESIDFDDDAIGKTVFLTREEADQKLKDLPCEKQIYDMCTKGDKSNV